MNTFHQVKNSLLFAVLILSMHAGKATNYLPNYAFSASLSPYVPISSGTILGSGTLDDVAFNSQNIGFPFVYNGNTYTQFSVNSNGMLAFGTSVNSWFDPLQYVVNTISPLCEDLQGQINGEIRYDTLGTAPFRRLVVQFSNWSFYESINNNDTLNFQIVLYETTNKIDFKYNVTYFGGPDQEVGVGLMGAGPSEFVNRTTSTDWNATTSGSSNSDLCLLSGSLSVLPFSGLTYTFAAPPVAYVSSDVTTASSFNTSIGATNQEMVKINILVDGSFGTTALSELTVNTTGTSNLASITDLKVFYTGKSSSFSSTVQFGPTVPFPSASNLVIDSINLPAGDNYFWVAYDISGSAALGDTLDAEIASVKVGGVVRIPSTTAPAGVRVVSNPMLYVGSAATQTILQSVGQGTSDNAVLGLTVVMSATGAPINLTQFDLNTNGTTDTANIRNIKVWYTGNSSAFNTGVQFGTTLPNLPGTTNYSITGNQSLVNDTNYFWLTYDIESSSTIGNVVDAECSSIIVAGFSQTPGVTAPFGSRQIRADYCNPIVSNASNSCNWGYFITAVSTSGATGDLNNTSGCNGNANNYINNSNQTLTVKPTETVTMTLGDFTNWITYAAWIDYNQDGVFDNVTERVFQGSLIQNEGSVTQSFTVPCSALTGTTRMRIRGGDYWWFGSPIGDPCSDIGYGETEDYNVVILPNPVAFAEMDVVQQTGVVSPGTPNKLVLKIPITNEGCGIATVNAFNFSLAGTTAASDILNAKLYSTGASKSFNTSNLRATVASPTSSFVFTLTDTIESNGTTNYWLAYDVAPGAILTHVIDASLDSILILGNFETPANGNPSGDVVITAPMTYVGSTVTQTMQQKVGRGSEDNEIIGIKVITSSTGAPVNATQFDLNTTGTTDTANIRNIKVWYTGNSSVFATDMQFGSTLPNLTGSTSYSIMGDQSLVNDTNYFWLTYDIEASSTIGNIVDAECGNIIVASASHIPSVTAPTGERMIREEYCAAIVSNLTNSCNWGYFITAVSTTGATGDLNNTSGCNGNLNNYIYNKNETLTIKPNETVTMTLGDFTNWITYAAWIDYNQDGVFDNATERVFQGSLVQNEGSVTQSFTIPCSALPGTTRMRIRGGDYWWFGSAIGDPCSDIGYGETEDYNVMVLPNPVVFSEVDAVQQTGLVAPGTLNRAILQIPITNEGCGIATVNAFHFSLAGTTAAADILNAKLYSTGASNSFNTANLRATIPSPTSSFVFTLTDTIENNGTTNYWLAYDVAPGATLAHVMDARLDSIFVLGNFEAPANGNPSGDVLITAPMTYVGSAVTQAMQQKVGRGTEDNEIIGIQVITSSTGAAVNVTQLDLNTTGTTDTANIRNIKVWYTGNSSTFATLSQFGATLPNLPGTTSYSIMGDQDLFNDTNYFWLTYDIEGSSVIGNVVDAECGNIIVAGSSQVPSITSPAGDRMIREDYCTAIVSNAANSCSWGYFITAVSTSGASGDLNNTSGCNGNTNNYVYNKNQTLTIKPSETITMTLGDFTNWITYAAWIDYNQDGVFDNATERVFQGSLIQNEGSVTQSFTVPCLALPGTTRMRIRGGDYWWFGSPIGDPCSDIGYGETEDYTVVVLPNPVLFMNTDAVQQIGSAAPGTLNKAILKIPITNAGCGVATVNEVHVSLTGTTTASDIVNAKLYSTGSSNVYSATNLRATLPSPSGSLVFTLTDTIESNGTTNYWLAYDVAVGATLTNVIDARLDSVLVLGQYHIPANGNPTGNIEITAPMTYVGSEATQNMVQKVERGTSDNEVLGVRVIMSHTGAPLDLTELSFNSNGTTDTAEIRNIKVWYTGNSSTFTTGLQFGSTLANLPGSTSYTIAGNQSLMNDTNYFWLSYDVVSSAMLLNAIDAEVTSVLIDGVTQIPAITAPLGNRLIRSEYCAPSTGGFPLITNVTLGSMNFNPPTSVGPNYYTQFPVSVVTTNIVKLSAANLSVTTNDDAVINAWIDYNDDGVFDPTEMIPITLSTGGSGIAGNVTFTVPGSALEGIVKMRIMTRYSGNPNTDPCRLGGSGETQDYIIRIMSLPPPTTYVWNQTTPADYNVASNWTPSRTNPLGNDKLIFNGSGTVEVNNVQQETVSKIMVSNTTNLQLNSSTLVNVTVADSLDLTAGNIASNNVNFVIGTDTTVIGSILGAGFISGNGTIKRWINSSSLSYHFPIANGAADNTADLTFTTPPSVAGSVLARYIPSNPGNLGLPLTEGAVTVQKVSPYGYWRFTAGNGFAGGEYTLTLTASGMNGVTSPSGLVMVRRSISIAAWSLEGIHVTTTGSSSNPLMQRTNIGVFGEFAAAADSSVNPLPVKLLSFRANVSKSNVILNWAVASETGNDGFDLERSENGKVFTKIGFVKGRGNSNVRMTYAYTDPNAFTVTNQSLLYYRLRQRDLNGNTTYSNVVQVNEAENTGSDIVVYPNPFNNTITIDVVAGESSSSSFVISDMQGRVVRKGQLNIAEGVNHYTLDQLEELNSGIYFLTIKGSESTTIKLVKTN